MYAFTTPTDILIGDGSLSKLTELAPKYGKRALVVFGGGSLEAAGVIEKIKSQLKTANLEFDIFSGVTPEPDLQVVEKLRTVMRDGFDLAISIGGGSVIDATKAAAGLVLEDAPAGEYQQGRAITTKGLNHIAIPTTAGTGSEVTPNAVITDSQRQMKISIRGEHLMPVAAIVDSELLLTLPPKITAESGMDALSHAIESYVSAGANPFTEALSLKAATLLATGLLHAFEDGSNQEARSKCAWGSVLAGLALANARLGVVHGLAHPLGARLHISHGMACAMLLPLSVEYNAKVAQKKYQRIAEHLAKGFTDSKRTGLTATITRNELKRRSITTEFGGPNLVNILKDLITQLGIPLHLDSTTKPSPTELEQMAKDGMPSGSMRANPREVTLKDAVAILKNLSCE